MGVRVRGGWWRWLPVPWTEPLLASVIVAAAASPVFLVGAADVWRDRAQDDIAARSVELASLERNGIDVTHEIAFAPEAVARADVAIRERTGRIDGLAEPDVTYYTLPALATAGPDTRVGPTVRLVAREGAIESLDIVAGRADGTGGVYVSTWFAERNGLALGDFLGFDVGPIEQDDWDGIVRRGGASNVLPIAGLYEPLWSPEPDHEPPEYWQRAPRVIVPVYLDAFGGPNSELIVVDRAALLASGLTGLAKWRAPMTELPSTYDGLLERRAQMRGLELALVDDGELGQAIGAISLSDGARPRITTELFDTVGEAVQAALRLGAPLASIRGVGGVVGLIGMLAVGVFFVDRRRSEFRLLASEGESWPTMSGRVAAQLFAPVLLGAALGSAAASFGLWWLGLGNRPTIDALPWSVIGIVAAIALALAALVAGVAGSRSLRGTSAASTRSLTIGALVVLVGALLFTWVQVARSSLATGATVDLNVIALPIFAVLVASIVASAAIAAVASVTAAVSRHLPPTLFLAARRLAAGGGGLRTVSSAIGLGVGLLAFAVALTSTLDETVDVKLATQVGGASAVTLLDDVPDAVSLPPGTTLVRTLDSGLVPGGARVRVVAIDRSTWAAAVSWRDPFGDGPEAVLDELDRRVDGGVPAIAVEGENAPRRGAFGFARTFRYEVVSERASLPGAGGSQNTLLVDAARLDELAALESGYATVADAVADGFELPTGLFRRQLVSQASLDELVLALDDAAVRYRDPVSAAEQGREPRIVAARAAFGYLGVLGVVAGVAALVALGLYLDTRRRARALAGVMTRSMGLARSRGALVTTVEVAVVLVTSVVAALIAVPFVVRRLSARFDPAPDVPPPVGALVDWFRLSMVAGVAIGLTSAIVWFVEWRDARRPAGEVLRRGG